MKITRQCLKQIDQKSTSFGIGYLSSNKQQGKQYYFQRIIVIDNENNDSTIGVLVLIRYKNRHNTRQQNNLINDGKQKFTQQMVFFKMQQSKQSKFSNTPAYLTKFKDITLPSHIKDIIERGEIIIDNSQAHFLIHQTYINNWRKQIKNILKINKEQIYEKNNPYDEVPKRFQLKYLSFLVNKNQLYKKQLLTNKIYSQFSQNKQKNNYAIKVFQFKKLVFNSQQGSEQHFNSILNKLKNEKTLSSTQIELSYIKFMYDAIKQLLFSAKINKLSSVQLKQLKNKNQFFFKNKNKLFSVTFKLFNEEKVYKIKLFFSKQLSNTSFFNFCYRANEFPSQISNSLKSYLQNLICKLPQHQQERKYYQFIVREFL